MPIRALFARCSPRDILFIFTVPPKLAFRVKDRTAVRVNALFVIIISSAFKKATGKTYSDYLIDLKISHAKKLLRHTSESIMLIAENSGFESICNFNRAFKKKTQLSPSQYRKKHQKTSSFNPIDA